MSLELKFVLGQQLTVINAGKSYSGYEGMAELMRLTKWAKWRTPHEGSVGTVVAISKHEQADAIVAEPFVRQVRRLLEFDQPGLFVRRLTHLGDRVVDVSHLEADVVLPAGRVLRKEADERRIVTQRFDQLDLAVGQVHEADINALLRHRLGFGDVGGAQHVAIQLHGLGDGGGRDPDMVQSSDHDLGIDLSIAAREIT